MTKRRKFSAEFKAQVVLEVLSGTRSTGEICREHQIKPQVLSSWKAQFLENAPQLFERSRDQDATGERIAELERLLGQKTLELEIAKKASSILGSPSSRNGPW